MLNASHLILFYDERTGRPTERTSVSASLPCCGAAAFVVSNFFVAFPARDGRAGVSKSRSKAKTPRSRGGAEQRGSSKSSKGRFKGLQVDSSGL